MATAGARYKERTSNIWSYAHRGDLTSLRAALNRSVNPNLTNTVGWTPCHAAAAAGQTKALRLLLKSGADVEIKDRGGNLPAHQAAKNGHGCALKVLQELGADITKVRLSQVKGRDAREVLMEAYRKAGTAVDGGGEGEKGEEEAPAVVGYARKQAKSTAFWGPRRTPISTKIKKKIIKDKRKKKRDKKGSLVDAGNESAQNELEDGGNSTSDTCLEEEDTKPIPELSYVETVRQIKRNKKQKRRQQQFKKAQSVQQVEEDKAEEEETRSTSIEEDLSLSDESSEEGDDLCSKVNGFAALSLMSDSDTSSDEE